MCPVQSACALPGCVMLGTCDVLLTKQQGILFHCTDCASQSATSCGPVPSARQAQLGKGPHDVAAAVHSRRSDTSC